MASSAAAGRAAVYDTVFGADVMKKVRASRVLIVGAGGIGCELLKDLVLVGFGHLEVVDLDTIDVSNLNRQFLFRPHHVGQSKSAIAAQAVATFNPRSGPILSHHGNIIRGRMFSADFFRGFDLVINALDNQAARSHVNRMCLATHRTLVEGGSTGFAGQAHTIRGGATLCYDCRPKPAQKAYPVCTIRSTPDKPVHCIAWAKELHALLVGDAPNSVLYEPDDVPNQPPGASSSSATAAAAAATATAPASESVYMRAVRRPADAVCDDNAALSAWASSAFDALFRLEIEKKLSMGDTYRTARCRPTPLSLDRCSGYQAALEATLAAPLPAHRTPSLGECAGSFLSALQTFFADPERRQAAREGSVAFDKDDDLSMRLVAAAANLRAITFGIPASSEFEIKSIAGNIVPAVATTNAVVAGLEAMEAVRALAGRDPAEASYAVVLTTGISGGRTVSGDAVPPPNPACSECGRARVILRLDTKRLTLRQLIRGVLCGALGFEEPNILFAAAEAEEGSASGSHFSFLEDEDDASLLDVALSALPAGGVTSGKLVTVDDFAIDGARVEAVVVHVDCEEGGAEAVAAAVEVVGEFSAPEAAKAARQAKAKKVAEEEAAKAAAEAAGSEDSDSDDDIVADGSVAEGENGDDDDDDDVFELLEETGPPSPPSEDSTASRKRPREDEDEDPKRARLGDAAFVEAAVEAVHASAPLVHCITNFVSMDLAANAILAAHASPAMVHAPEEAGGFARIAGCVVVNVGTIDSLWAAGMTTAVRAATESKVPVVLDPVGVGAPGLGLRSSFCKQLCMDASKGDSSLKLIRGNASEIAALATICDAGASPVEGMARSWVASHAPTVREGLQGFEPSADGSAADGDGKPRGADSTMPWFEAVGSAVRLALHCRCAVAVTGPVDVVVAPAGAGKLFVGVCGNGEEMLTRITAAGCALSAVCGVFLAADQPATAAQAAMTSLAALAVYGGAANSAKQAIVARGATPGPGSMRSELLDQLHLVTPQQAVDRARTASDTIG